MHGSGLHQCLGAALTALRRDWRAGELRLIAFATVLAVAALSSVGLFTDRVRRAIEDQATELLAADLVLESANPIRSDLMDRAVDAGLEHTRSVSFRSMALAADRLELSEVKAVETGYPLRGQLRTSRELFGTETLEREIPAPGSVWVDSRLLQALQIGVGDDLKLGNLGLRVDRIITYEPDRGGELFNIAPRLLINLADLDATGLIAPGSRAEYRLLLSGSTGTVAAFREQIRQDRSERIKVQGIRDARPELRRALERAEQFLGLAVIVAVALCGLAIAMAARRFALRHYDTCAVLRCLGANQQYISGLFATQMLALAVLTSAAGAILGYAGQSGLAVLLRDMTARALPAPSPWPLMAALAAGVVAVTGFAVPQLWRLRSVPPLRVLRRDLAPAPVSSRIVFMSAIVTLALLTPWQSGNQSLTAWVFGGLLGTAIALAAGATLGIGACARLRSATGIAWRYGLANVARRAEGSIAQVVAIGLGVTALMLLTLVRSDLLDSWRNRLAPGTPNYFLINIQPDEVAGLEQFLRRRAAVTTQLFPMIRARLTQLNGRDLDPDSYADERTQRLAAREFNLSWAGRLQDDNEIVEGSWWPPEQSGDVLFSFEQDIAARLGVKVGDQLVWSAAGREVTGTVRNIRFVDWDTFNVNFFVIGNPGALDGLPATWITSFYLPDDRRNLLVELVRGFPSVTIIDVAALIGQVRAIMEQVSRTVEFVFGFTLLAGVLVLFAALQNTHDERRIESAVLRSLGADRGAILKSLAAEFLALGFVAGLLAACGATAISWLLARFVFELTFEFNLLVWLLAPLACTVIVVVTGLAGTRHVLHVPPMVALRSA
jgi:putative ABC transport system permease protein